jgi:serine/threonine protein phosphatase PrpC
MKDIRTPGLAMTRSFGDKAGTRAGTNAEPEITYFTINPSNKYILIASDGVWEHI